MTTLREAAQQAIALICSARLCEINSMSSRQEMLRLMIEATDTLRAALAEPVQESKILGSTVTEIWNAIEYAHDLGGPLHDRIKKLVEQRQNRAQPVQEPVAWGVFDHAEWERRQRRRIARAIERAHGIGGNDE